tara:strand:- start:21771 stop:22019 length:249 start_codon:yes stop_codon:yes gene_type:complete
VKTLNKKEKAYVDRADRVIYIKNTSRDTHSLDLILPTTFLAVAKFAWVTTPVPFLICDSLGKKEKKAEIIGKKAVNTIPPKR